MSVFTKAIKIYNDYGYGIRTGLNPYHFNNNGSLSYPFTCVYHYNSSNILDTGGGISPIEAYFLETLAESYNPKNIFIVGNAFGWSTIIMALLWPKAKIVAIDSGIEGIDNFAWIELTNKIASVNILICIV